MAKTMTITTSTTTTNDNDGEGEEEMGKRSGKRHTNYNDTEYGRNKRHKTKDKR